jgi:hyperosmotically inducible periplasmic protein
MMAKLIRWGVLVLAGIASAAPAGAQPARDAKTMVNDAWITTQVYAKFFADPDIKGRNINVDTTGGVVSLTGEVHSAAEHSQAVAKAKATDGVKQVIDKLAVTPGDRPATADIRDKVAATLPRDKEQVKAQAKTAAQRVGKEISDTWITTQVQAMYFLDRQVKGMQINVTTNGGVVTLSGSVDSEAVRQKALADAKSIEGVKQVVDKLSVKR